MSIFSIQLRTGKAGTKTASISHVTCINKDYESFMNFMKERFLFSELKNRGTMPPAINLLTVKDVQKSADMILL